MTQIFLYLIAAITLSAQVQAPAPAVKLEGCVSCHGMIEPMHR
jgi:hypothetical protein